jgi:hypothetical protein
LKAKQQGQKVSFTHSYTWYRVSWHSKNQGESSVVGDENNGAKHKSGLTPSLFISLFKGEDGLDEYRSASVIFTRDDGLDRKLATLFDSMSCLFG